MTIADNLQTLIDCKADMKAAIEEKGVTVSGGLSTYADAIRSIETGDATIINVPTGTKFGYSTFTTGPSIDTSEYRDMSYMFYNCYPLKEVPLYDTSNVTNMSYMFCGCQALTSVPLFDTSKVTSMNSMFSDCQVLTSVPLFDTSNVTNMFGMFAGTDIIRMPQFDTSKVTNMNSMISNCRYLTEIPLLDAGSISQMSMCRIFDTSSDSSISVVAESLKHLGGFKDLGKQQSVFYINDSGFLSSMPNLTRQSLLNVINNLYDRASAGYGILSIKFNTNHLSLLTDNDITIATSKGWTITT